MIKTLLILMVICFWQPVTVYGQEIDPPAIHLREAYQLLIENWPVSDKVEYQHRITELNRRIAGSGWHPDLQVSARVSYQSDVTEVPFSAPGTESPVFSKDHYNFSLNLTQSIYDGGRTRALQQAEQYAGDTELARVEMDMYSIRIRMEQVWFGLLLLQKEYEVFQLMREDIHEQLGLVRTRVENGVLLPGDELVMRAELIRNEQELTRINGRIKAGYSVLSELLGIEISTDVELRTDEYSHLPESSTDEMMRPEFSLFDAGSRLLEAQKKAAGSEMMPAVSLFATSAYGRPGLNVFEDDLQLYWILGLRAQWSFKNSRNAKLRTEVISLAKNSIDADRNAFSRNLNASLSSLEEEIDAMRILIEQDEEVVRLRTLVAEEKKNMLMSGTITSTEYINERNAENRARLNLETRKIRLTQLIAEHKTTRGDRWND
jgi:outer membrane protein TolC